MSDVKLPDPMTYCKARMIDASLCGRNLESEMFGKIIDELARHNALREAVAWERECEWLNDIVTEQYACVPEIAPEEEEISVSYFESRSEVDRLIADCTEESCHASPE